jgi:Tfp pilus assembly protein PilE
MKKQKGISLIVLVITIIVIIILAGSVILSLSSNNPITSATEATFKTTIAEYNSELALTISSKYVQNFAFDPATFNLLSWDGDINNTSGTVKEYIKNMTVIDGPKYEIQAGKLVYTGVVQTEKNWILNMGLENKVGLPCTKIKPQVSDINKHMKPYVPQGFTYKEGTWNTGLVIQDTLGNEFVWVPVDGTNVPYAKWCITGIAYDNVSIANDTLPTGIANELNQKTNFGGFYIARYESGIGSGNILVSKKGVPVWNMITYPDSKIKAELMYDTASVKSGLITGTQWDTTLEWIKDSGKDVINSMTWGNYNDSLDPANVIGYSSLQLTGYSEYWKANNIYDLAGNVWEWTNEKYGANYVFRGGECNGTGSYPVASRRDFNSTVFGDGITFRVVLYIK